MIEGLCSLIRHLEKAVVKLQQDIADYRAELKLSRTHTLAVSTRYGDSIQTTVEAPARLGTETQSCPPPVVSPPAPTELEQLMCSFIAEQRRRRPPPRRQRPARRDWSDVLCFSCGKSSNAATRCPNLNDSFPFMQPG